MTLTCHCVLEYYTGAGRPSYPQTVYRWGLARRDGTAAVGRIRTQVLPTMPVHAAQATANGTLLSDYAAI